MITNIIWINIHIELYSLQKICVLICVYALYICISMVIYHTHTHIYIYIHTHSFSLLVITLIILMKKLRLRDLKWFDSWYVRMWKEAIDKSVIHIIIHNPSYVCHISLPLYTQEHTYTHLTSKLLMEKLRTLSSTVFLAIKKKNTMGNHFVDTWEKVSPRNLNECCVKMWCNKYPPFDSGPKSVALKQ